MSVADTPDWTASITIISGPMSTADLPDWTEGVAFSGGGGGGTLIGETNQTGANTALGYDALGITVVGDTDTTGSTDQVAVGFGALSAAGSSSNSNVAVGYDAANALTSATSNTCVGYEAGFAVVSGNGNVLVGYQANVLNGTDAENVSIGTQSRAQGTAITPSVSVGTRAGNGMGAQSTCVGYQSGYNASGQTEATLVGFGTYPGDTGFTALGWTAGGVHTNVNTYGTALGYLTRIAGSGGGGHTALGADSSGHGAYAQSGGTDQMALGTVKTQYSLGGAGWTGTSQGSGPTPSWGGGTGTAIFVGNCGVAPSSGGGNPTGGGILFVQSGALKYLGSSGTLTTIANA